MKSFIILLLFLPVSALAHCPHEFMSDGEALCMKVEWMNGESKVRGQFEPSTQSSPYLVPMREIPQKWVYSQALIHVWKKGDTSHQPVAVENLRIFPYMHMESGHHHSTSYDFYYDSAEQAYYLRQVAFQSMRGCWSLRWTDQATDDMMTSQKIMDIYRYTNLTGAEQKDQQAFCGNEGSAPDDGHHH
jgi:hypothetical protein